MQHRPRARHAEAMTDRLGEDCNRCVCKVDVGYSSNSKCLVTYTGQSREKPLLSCNSMSYDILYFTLLRPREMRCRSISHRNTA
jgi:hypothetical protein